MIWIIIGWVLQWGAAILGQRPNKADLNSELFKIMQYFLSYHSCLHAIHVQQCSIQGVENESKS